MKSCRHLILRSGTFGWFIAALLLSPSPAGSSPAVGAPEPAAAFWVFFQDKGPAGATPEDWAAIARSYPAASWARRMKAGSAPVPDERDRPLWSPYVTRVAEHGALRHESRWLNAVSIELTPEARVAVNALPFVVGMRPVAVAAAASLGPAFDDTGRPLGQTTRMRTAGADPLRPSGLSYGALDYGPSLFQLEEIMVPPVHEMGFSANRVRMMMIDTGFRLDHEAFAQTAIIDTWDFVFGDPVVQNEEEDDENQHNHGTGCWGTAAGYAPGQLIGPAYGASFALSKTEDIRSETRAEEDFYVAALEWADQLGVQVTSASLNYVCFDDDFCYQFEDKDGDTAVITVAIDVAAERGILCVNSQGNYGCYEGSLGTPADADSMLAVGAVDSLNVIAGFSACGPTFDGRIKPEVLARGVDTYWTSAHDTDTYGYASGTSLSTPLIGATAALLLEAHPEWSNMELRQALIETADRTGNPDNQYGWGRVNAQAALAWQPIVYPLPFSLVSPIDGSETESRRPTFTWRMSRDPDTPDPLSYSLRIVQSDDPQIFFTIEAGSDTTVTLENPLAPETAYHWEVLAEDAAGLTRLSRQVWNFITPEASAVDRDPGAGALAGLQRAVLTSSPNPFREQVRFHLTLAGQTAAEPDADPMHWRVFDPTGRRVAGGRAPGHSGMYSAEWDGRALDGGPVSPGVYYLEARVGSIAARETILRLEP
jgi:hypothetical protein